MHLSTTEFDEPLLALLTEAVETHGRPAASRAASCFSYLGIRAPQDKGHYSRFDLARVPNCGRRTLALINAIAARSGITIREDVAPTPPLKPPPSEKSLYEEAWRRFDGAFQAGTGITLTATEVAAIGSVILLAKMRPTVEGADQGRPSISAA